MIIKHLHVYYPQTGCEELLRIANILESIAHSLEKLIQINGVAQQSNPSPSAISDSIPESMTVTEAAKLLRISTPKMYELLQAGKIHSIRIGRKIVVSRTSLLAFLTNGH